MSQSVLKKPVLTEKITDQSELFNRYGFIVDKKATKTQVKSAIETMYNVKVVSVNTMNYGGGKGNTKFTNKGVVTQKAKAYKKALVTVKEGDIIDIYESI